MKQATKKTITKKVIQTAAKTLSNPDASKKSKSEAGKVLATRSIKERTIKPAPKIGKLSRNEVKNAVSSLSQPRSPSVSSPHSPVISSRSPSTVTRPHAAATRSPKPASRKSKK